MLDLDDTVLAAAEEAFAEWATWTPAAGASAQVPVIFFDHAKDVKLKDGEMVEEITPQVSIRLSRWPGTPTQRDTLLLRGILYQLTDVNPDGAGAAVCRLRWANEAQKYATSLPPSSVSP